MTRIDPPTCWFEGDPTLAPDAERFITATLADPTIMMHAINSLRVVANGEIIYGVPSGETAKETSEYIQLAIGTLTSDVDLGFNYDRTTSARLEAKPETRLPENKPSSLPEYEALAEDIRTRIARLGLFVGRVANPFDLNQQAQPPPQRRQQRKNRPY